MRAVQFSEFGGPEVLHLADLPEPEPQAGEVVVDMHAASANPIDWKLRRGLLRDTVPLSLPATLGRDGAGTVIATGRGASPGLVGSRVCFLAPRGHGTWAERVAIPASLLVAVPDGLSLTDAASLPLAAVSAWIGLVRSGGLSSGMRVLVHAGAGGVGSLAVQIARHFGAEVFATCSASNVDYVRSLGAHEAIPYDEVPFESACRDLDLVFDLVGGEVHRRSYAVLRPGGMMVFLSAKPVEDRSAEFRVSVQQAQILPDPEAIRAVLDLVAIGAIRPTVERVLPFSEFAEAHRATETGHGRGKTVITLSGVSNPQA